MKKLTIHLVFALFCVKQLFCVKEGVSYKFTKNACNKFNPKFVYNTSCRFRSVNRTLRVSNVEIVFHPNVKLDNIRLDITTHKRFGTVYRPNLIIKYSEHFCDALNNKTYSHLVNVLKKSYERTSNVFAPCPKSGTLYLHNTTVDTSKFPQFVPVGEYRIDVRVMTYMNDYEEYVFTYESFLEVKPLAALEF